MSAFQLPADVAAKYTCPIVPTRIILPNGDAVDLRTISLAEADALVAKGFDYLIKRTTSLSSDPQKPVVVTQEEIIKKGKKKG